MYYDDEDYDYRPYYRVDTPAPRYVSPLAERARVAEEMALELRIELDRANRFGDGSKYGADDALLFKRRADSYKPRGTWNTFPDSYEFIYVAVKVKQGWWYITGKGSHRYTWEQLVEEHLVNASEVWEAAEWRSI